MVDSITIAEMCMWKEEILLPNRKPKRTELGPVMLFFKTTQDRELTESH